MSQSPFPGMDPYLEAPHLWQGVHTALMAIFQEQLTPQLAPRYVTSLETQVVIERIVDDTTTIIGARPDVAVMQPSSPVAAPVATAVVPPAPVRLTIPIAMPTRLVSLHIRQQATDRLVAVIELLSPYNKRPGDDRTHYLEKRMDYLAASIHFIEIDLLRQWPHMPLEGDLPRCAYVVAVCNFYERPYCDVWPIQLNQPLPTLPVPLIKPDDPVSLDLGQALGAGARHVLEMRRAAANDGA